MEPSLKNALEKPPERVITRGTVSTLLDNVPYEAKSPEWLKMRASLKAEALQLAIEKEVFEKGAEARPVEIDGVPLKITGVGTRTAENGITVMTVVVDHPDLPPDANPFEFVNPPIIAKDDTENPFEAFREIVAEAVAYALTKSKQ